MLSFTVFCVVVLGTNAKPEGDYELKAGLMQAAHDVLEGMLYAKEHVNMARSAHLDEESFEKSTEELNDENNYLSWDMYSALDDGVGVTPEYFQSFMVAEMADILLEAPLSDEVQADEPVPVSNRFFCGSCFTKYKACKDVCFGLVSVSADHAIDIIPCATTCLQRLSACCVAQRDWPSKSKGQTESLSGVKGQLSGVKGAGLGGSKDKFGQGQAIVGGSGGKFGQAQGLLSSSGGKFGQAQGVLSSSGGKFGQAQGILAGTGDKFGQIQGVLSGSNKFGGLSGSDKFSSLSGGGDKIGQAQGAVIAENEVKLGQAQAVVQSGDIGNIKGTGAVFGQANLFGVNIGNVPGINLEGLPEKIQAIFGGVNQDKAKQTIADLNLASLSESTTIPPAYPTQQVVAPEMVTSVFTTTSEYTVPTVQAVTTEYTVTSIHTTTSEYQVTSSVITPPVINY